MEAYHQPYRFMRPPPPPFYSLPEPSVNQSHYHHSNAPPRQQVPPQGPWYSGQFQYHASHSLSPPPPNWTPTPPPQSDHFFPRAHPFPLYHNSIPPYHAQAPHNQFPPSPRSQVPPLPDHSQSQIAHPNVQEWNNSKWAPHQGWEHSAHSNESYWASRAREWATAKSVMDNHPPHSQFPQIGRLGDQNKYLYPDHHLQSHPVQSYQPYSISHELPVEAGYIGSKPGSYDIDGHSTYAAFSNGPMTGESTAVFPRQETSQSILLQEVPSSYSSGSGKEGTPNQNEHLYKSLHFPISSDQRQHQFVHPSIPSLGRSMLLEQPHFQCGNPSAGSTDSLADQPLDFDPRFNHNHDINLQPGYAHSSSVNPVSAMPSLNNWAPTFGSGTAYTSSGPQPEPAMAVPPQISDHSRIVGQCVHPPVPSFGIGVGSSLHSTTGFSTDPYGVSASLERPKKASVPNWIREEIIKKKPAITSSTPEYPIEGTEAIEVDAIDKSVLKDGQEDIKSLDSSRSVEEEDDDEESVEAVKTAAINLEIKRILTEVLSKVTDDLFDEIATKVVKENDLVVEDPSIDNQNQKPSLSSADPKPPSNVIFPFKANESYSNEDVNKKPSSYSAGNILGLVNYASDDDDDDEIPISRMHDSVDNSVHPKSSVKVLSDNVAFQNGSLQDEFEDLKNVNPCKESGHSGTVPVADKTISCAKDEGLSDYKSSTGESKDDNVDLSYSLTSSSQFGKHAISVNGRKVLGEEKVATEPRLLEEDAVDDKKLLFDDLQDKKAKTTSDKNGVYEISGFSRKHIAKQLETCNIAYERQDVYCKRQDDTHLTNEKTVERSGSKHGFKTEDLVPVEKGKEPELRKKSFELDAEERTETQRLRKYGDKERTYRKQERVRDGMGDRSRHKPVNDIKRHKRRRSSSLSDSICLNNKDNSVVSHANDSSDDTSEDSRRKLHSRKQNISPSPSRRRSPHSKRRHSPYYSSVAPSRRTQALESKAGGRRGW